MCGGLKKFYIEKRMNLDCQCFAVIFIDVFEATPRKFSEHFIANCSFAEFEKAHFAIKFVVMFHGNYELDQLIFLQAC